MPLDHSKRRSYAQDPAPRTEVRIADRLMDADEIAAVLNVPVSWVRSAAREGAIPHVKLGRYVRFDEDDVLAWVAECKTPGRQVTFRKAPVGARR
jgi:excisionase family DNA binding protein